MRILSLHYVQGQNDEGEGLDSRLRGNDNTGYGFLMNL